MNLKQLRKEYKEFKKKNNIKDNLYRKEIEHFIYEATKYIIKDISICGTCRYFGSIVSPTNVDEIWPECYLLEEFFGRATHYNGYCNYYEKEK